jgi:hypothetical protein
MDVQERMRLHIEATRTRDTWARRALDLLDAGKERAARDAAVKAERWDARVKELEARSD